MLVKNLKCLIEEYNKTDFSNLSYQKILQIEHYIEHLSLIHETMKIRLKSESLRNDDFDYLIKLTKNNYKDLISLKQAYKNRKGIYVLHFSNGKCYVGQTNNFCRRLDEYFDINNKCYIGHNEEIKQLFKDDADVEVSIYFLETNQDRNLLEATYIEKFKSNNPLYGYNKTRGNE